MATGDFGSGRMPTDMFYNCNEEIKRQKERTIRNQNMLVGRDRDRRFLRLAGTFDADSFTGGAQRAD